MMRNQKGFIALISVLIIGAVVLVISIGLSLRSIGETNMALNEESSNRAASLSDACAENALLKLKTNLSYTGGETVTVQSGLTCQILTISGSGNINRTIQTQSTVSGYTSKTQVIVTQVRPNTVISSWEKVSDF